MKNHQLFPLVLLSTILILISCGKEKEEVAPTTPSNTTPERAPDPAPDVRTTPIVTPTPTPVTPTPSPVTPSPILAPKPFLVGTIARTTHNWVYLNNADPSKTISKLLLTHEGSEKIQISSLRIRFSTANLTFKDVIVLEPGVQKEVWLGVEQTLKEMQFYLSGSTVKLEVSGL